MSNQEDFWLYDLEVETVLGGRTPVCRHIEGENLVFLEHQKISMYALAAILPLLPAKQRETTPHDCMTTNAEITCPDPHCGGRFRIKRLSKRGFFHAETICPGTRATLRTGDCSLLYMLIPSQKSTRNQFCTSIVVSHVKSTGAIMAVLLQFVRPVFEIK